MKHSAESVLHALRVAQVVLEQSLRVATVEDALQAEVLVWPKPRRQFLGDMRRAQGVLADVIHTMETGATP